MKYIVGTKVGMVNLFEANGKNVPATIIHCEPNVVLEVINSTKGVKVGFNSTNENKVNKAHAGIFKKVGAEVMNDIKTFTNIEGNFNVGDKISVDTFNVGECVDAQAYNKGHGYTGAIKR
jgi:large subunit ribosomal protein L3